MNSIKIFTINLLFISILLSCEDMQDIKKRHTYPKNTMGFYILNEGLFNNNNSTLTKYIFNPQQAELSLQTHFFQQINKRGLGDTANDMQRYGNKIYIVVNVSSQIEVMDYQSGKSIKRIPMFNKNGEARQPRYIDFFKNKAYVCSFDGTVVQIDTATLEIEKWVKVGRNPDGICIANQKIYVSNSGGLSFPNYDNSVSVIDISTFKEIKKITVGTNPYKLHADSQGDIYVITRGDYDNIKYAFHKIDSKNNQLVTTFKDIQAYNFEIFQDKAYLYGHDFNTGKNWIKVFDCMQEKIINQDLIKEKNILIKTLYALAINPFNNDIYVLDAQDYFNFGDLLCFDSKGYFKFRINEVGINPSHIVFIQN